MSRLPFPTREPCLPNSLRLLVVRHGTAEQDSLPPTGVAEARATAAVLKQQAIVAVVTSPTGRTQQATAIIVQAVGLPVVVVEDDGFMVKHGEAVEQAKTRALVVIITHLDLRAALLRHAAAKGDWSIAL